MARCLIIGCGCRGRSLASALRNHGHAVRGTTRDPARLHAIEATGAEAILADPDRVATISTAFEHVSVACLLLGSAGGAADAVSALHGTRLEMLLARMLDTTVHGVVYEVAGSVDPTVLRAGAAIVSETCEGSRIPYVLLGADPLDHGTWLRAARGAVDRVLGAVMAG